jgi:hypothetical protein
MSSVKTATLSIKSSCTGCNKEFTKDTIDKHAGVCGRCYNKNIGASANIQASKINMEIPILQITPPSNNILPYSLPTDLVKLSNMSIPESKKNQALQLSVRLDNWYKASRNNIPENNAATDVVYVLIKNQLPNINNVPNHNLLNFEKLFSFMHRALMD